jgi:hypothetical protein
MDKYLGNSLTSTGNRLYRRVQKNKKRKRVLVSWSIKQCGRCGKFIKKTNHRKMCPSCAKIITLERVKNWVNNNRERHYLNVKKSLLRKKENGCS